MSYQLPHRPPAAGCRTGMTADMDSLVMIVARQPAVRERLRVLAEWTGAPVVTAAGPDEARLHEAILPTAAVVIVGVGAPDAAEISWLRGLRARHPETVVVLQTGAYGRARSELVRAYGSQLLLPDGFDYELLEAVLQNARQFHAERVQTAAVRDLRRGLAGLCGADRRHESGAVTAELSLRAVDRVVRSVLPANHAAVLQRGDSGRLWWMVYAGGMDRGWCRRPVADDAGELERLYAAGTVRCRPAGAGNEANAFLAAWRGHHALYLPLALPRTGHALLWVLQRPATAPPFRAAEGDAMDTVRDELTRVVDGMLRRRGAVRPRRQGGLWSYRPALAAG